jgi:hypothetical protein
MIRRAVTGLALLGFVVWSLLGLGAWGVVALGGDVLRFLARALLSGNPDAAQFAETVTHVLQGVGGWVIALTWFTGSMLIAAAAAVLRRASTIDARTAHFEWRSAHWPERDMPREMKDVTPPRESRPERLSGTRLLEPPRGDER